MRIQFHPQRRDGELAVSINGDSLTLNGWVFDLAQVTEGAKLTIDSDVFCAPVERKDGQLEVHLLLPHGPEATEEQLFPPVVDLVLGDVPVPGHGALQPETLQVVAIDWSRLEVPVQVSQLALDMARYSRRAAVKDKLVALMAAENMARVRNGTWSVQDLVLLMSDASVKTALEMINTLAFELAADVLASSNNPLLTPEIKSGWVSKLQEHFYLS